MKHALNAIAINRARKPTKLIDGAGLFYLRNRDGTLTPWQRLRQPGGKSRDVKVGPPFLGDVTTAWLFDIRRRAHALKTGGPIGGTGGTPPFSDLWERYLAAVIRWSAATRANYDTRMKRYVGVTRLWSLPIGTITVLDIEDAVREARENRPLLAPHLLANMRGAFRWAISRGEATHNPASAYIDGLRHIERKPKGEKLPALVDLGQLRKVLAAIEGSNLFAPLRHALLVQAFTVQRSGTIAPLRWADLDLEAGQWTIRRSGMKVKDQERGDLVLPLHPAVVALLDRLPRKSQWCFPSPSDPKRHIDKAHLARAMARNGYAGTHTPHGWRSALKTIAEDAIGEDGRPLFAPRWVEDVLDHKVPGIEGHYNRSRAQDGMAKVLRWWGDQLTGAQP